ncbi:MAG: putative DNA binding domain-containing protein [Muribaculaceae bacterium]|nr:putative DNA binding domain-containing protein [Muribaculaceae bacterium]
MALPINIEDLLNKRKVESTRIEFKSGWNPDKIYHTICAFATDLENIGGGYILVGVEQDENGIAKRPVKGIALESIDSILQDMVGYDAKISSSNLKSISYNTKVSVEEVDGQTILAIWVPTGPNRPYCVAESVVTKNKSPQKYYVRSKSSTIEAKGETLDEVRALANRIPFDDRGNEAIKIDDISGILVYDHLKAVKSKLAENFIERPLIDILDEMELLTGPTEKRLIKNVAAMMFCEHPEKFFPVTQVDIVIFPGGSIENPDVMIEVPKIVGPIPKIIRETLSYLRTNVIKKRISKPTDNEKSDKIYNYPYQSLEEAVVNALYHRDYQEREPVEITIEPSHIDILSYAGPDRSINAETIKAAQKLKARRYRNRRLGDFLKELDLTEGRATGIPTIQKALKENGSLPAVIETDEDRTYFLMTIPCREGFANEVASAQRMVGNYIGGELEQILGQSFVQVEELVNQSVIGQKYILGQLLEQMFVQVWNKSKSRPNVPRLSQATIDLLCLLRNEEMGAKILNSAIEFGETYELKRKILIPLINLGYVEMTAPDKPTSAKQTYKLTADGESLFNSDKS